MHISQRMTTPLAFMGLVLALVSCASASSKLAVSPENPRQLKNSSVQFSVLSNGKVVKGPVRWSSSNPSVATIGGEGSATLLSPGTTTITARLGEGEQGISTLLTVT